MRYLLETSLVLVIVLMYVRKDDIVAINNKDYRNLIIHSEMLTDTIGMQMEYEKSILKCKIDSGEFNIKKEK